MCFIGLDVGTTNVKALVVDEKGSVLSFASSGYQLQIPRDGWYEISAEELWTEVKRVLAQVAGQVSEPVEAIAVSAPGQAVVPVDRNGEPLYPFMTTIDSRTARQNEWWKENVDELETISRTGQAFSPIFTVNKIMWLRENCPELYEKTWKFMCVEDYINYRLSGEAVIDYTVAGRSMMFNIHDLKWDDFVLRHAGIDLQRLSAAVLTTTNIGWIRPNVASELGLSPDVQIIAGGHDQACGAIGCQVLSPGETMAAMGTVEVVISVLPAVPDSRKLRASHYPCAPHIARDAYTIMSINQNGGSLLKWYKNVFCGAEEQYALQNGLDPYTYIINSSSDRISDMFVLPHINGSETPVQDTLSAGAFVRMRAFHTKADITRGVLDSLAFDMRQNIEKMEEISGTGIRTIRVIGGGSKTPKLLQIKADVTGRPIMTMKVSESAALGAAMLAAVGMGRYGDIHEAAGNMAQVGQVFEPDLSKKSMYDERYEQYSTLYAALKEFHHRAAERSTSA